MTSPRNQKVCIDSTPFYHCMTRCIRRAYLCGYDKATKKNYDHRRRWIESKLLTLSQYFCIDLVSYAVMSNHYHTVLYVDKTTALKLTEQEVIRRWSKICATDELTKCYLKDNKLNKEQKKVMELRAKEWRKRLYSISWFMKFINERIARIANKEDGFTGAFWESRFKSQALLDEKAVLACMAYVDLNPIRSEKGVNSLLKSRYTSILKRLKESKDLDKPISFIGSQQKALKEPSLNITLSDYIELVKWTAINIEKKSSNYISGKRPSVLNEFGIDSYSWFVMTKHFEREFKLFIGPMSSLNQAYGQFKRIRISGKENCRRHFDRGS